MVKFSAVYLQKETFSVQDQTKTKAKFLFPK